METLPWFWVKTQQRQKVILTLLSGKQFPKSWLTYCVASAGATGIVPVTATR
jgi:hypothetical protein